MFTFYRTNTRDIAQCTQSTDIDAGGCTTNENHPQPLYPVWALPQNIRAAVEEAIAVSQAPLALVASSALAAASLAVQAKFDVKRLNGLVSPCSLFFITFAESGERKTTVDQMFLRPFGEFEENFLRIRANENFDLKSSEGPL